MPRESITFEEAGQVIERNWRDYFVPGVVKAFGVAEREGEIRFIIKVRSKGDVSSLRRRFGSREVEELPVFVEVLSMQALDSGTAANEASVPSRVGVALRFLLDRPGLFVVGAALLATAAWLGLNLR